MLNLGAHSNEADNVLMSQLPMFVQCVDVSSGLFKDVEDDKVWASMVTRDLLQDINLMRYLDDVLVSNVRDAQLSDRDRFLLINNRTIRRPFSQYNVVLIL